MTFIAAEYEPIDPGLYPAQLISIEDAESESFGAYKRWTWLLNMPDGSTQTLTANTSASAGPKSKAYKWAAALLGANPVAGQAVDLAGRRAQLHVIRNEEGFNRIETVLPVQQAPPVASQPAAVAPQPASVTPVPATPAKSDEIPF